MTDKPSTRLKAEHAKIRGELQHLRASIASLGDEELKERRRSMDRVIAFLEEHVELHTGREDRELYPLIEKRVGTMLTAALRVEHRFLIRNFDDLRILAAQPTPDAVAFTRLIDNLVGLLLAHFEAEEEVLFPIVDEMTAAGGAFDHA